MKNAQFNEMLESLETFANALNNKLNDIFDCYEQQNTNDFSKDFGNVSEVIENLTIQMSALKEVSKYYDFNTEIPTTDLESILVDLNKALQ